MAMGLFGCGGLFSPGTPWSVIVTNGNATVDFVVRFETGDSTRDIVVGSNLEQKLLYSGPRPANAAFLVMDPYTCRVVSRVETLPLPGAAIFVEWNGIATVAAEKLDDIYDLDDPTLHGAETERCDDVPPGVTPLPRPAPDIGQLRGDGELVCAMSDRSVRGGSFFARVESLASTVADCSVSVERVSATESPSVQFVNNDDQRLLAIAWLGDHCTSGAVVTLMPRATGYSAKVTTIQDPACTTDELQFRYRVELEITEWLEPADVVLNVSTPGTYFRPVHQSLGWIAAPAMAAGISDHLWTCEEIAALLD